MNGVLEGRASLRRRAFRTISALVASSLLCASCATVTTVHSLPPEARAYVDDRLLGETPTEFRDSSPFWTERSLTLKKDGYQTKTFLLRKDELRVGPLIGTILVLVPMFWMFGYPETLTFELEPEAAAVKPPGAEQGY